MALRDYHNGEHPYLKYTIIPIHILQWIYLDSLILNLQTVGAVSVQGGSSL